jgi:hypothetical protein
MFIFKLLIYDRFDLTKGFEISFSRISIIRGLAYFLGFSGCILLIPASSLYKKKLSKVSVGRFLLI